MITDDNKIKTVCFIGHRKIEVTDNLEQELTEYIEYLILNENVKVFLFGSRSEFDNLCYDVVSKLKEKYPDIKRVNVRCTYEYLPDMYMKFYLEDYEESIYPKECINSGKISYVRRNQAMVDDSDYCIFYYNENYLPPRRKYAKRCVTDYQPKSGTALAYHYAEQKKKIIKNFYKK